MARLTRGAKKAVTDEYVEQGSDDAHAEEDDFEPPKPKPKAKKDATAAAKGKGKGRKSKLQLFTSMPLDILCDVRAFLPAPPPPHSDPSRGRSAVSSTRRRSSR